MRQVYLGSLSENYNDIQTVVNAQRGRKNDGTVNRQWSGKPATMIRKVAKMQALREAFPEDLQGMYAAEEVDSGISDEQIAPPIDITPSAEVIEHSEPAPEPPAAELDSFEDIMAEDSSDA